VMRRDYYEVFRKIDEHSMANGLEIRWVGKAHYPLKFELEREHCRYLLLYIYEGQCVVYRDHDRDRLIDAGTVLLLPPGKQHYKSIGDKRLKCYGVSFSGDLVSSIVSEMSISTRKECRIGTNEHLLSEFHNLINIMIEFPASEHVVIWGAFLQLLGNIDIAINNANLQRSKDFSTKMRLAKSAQYICQNYNLELKIQDISEVAGYSVSWFENLFREYYNMSPIHYQMKQRIDKAKELIGSNMLNISEIGYAVGFRDPFYFSRVFKKYTGVSPKAYKSSSNM
jgi:AraC-like DNA-binding protein